jgi:hypothetical protein
MWSLLLRRVAHNGRWMLLNNWLKLQEIVLRSNQQIVQLRHKWQSACSLFGRALLMPRILPFLVIASFAWRTGGTSGSNLVVTSCSVSSALKPYVRGHCLDSDLNVLHAERRLLAMISCMTLYCKRSSADRVQPLLLMYASTGCLET